MVPEPAVLLWPLPFATLAGVGVWRSLVAHLYGVQVVARSNRATPTIPSPPKARFPLRGVLWLVHCARL